jgi:Zn-dependent membrane protease YugP
MIWIIFMLALLACIVLPGLWVKRVLAKYGEPENRYRDKGSGADLARHLLERFDMADVRVEETDRGDHYDPKDKAVRLSPNNFSGYSLTAVTVAAHEVGHAIQDARGEALFKARQRLVVAATRAERFGQIVLLLAPLVLLVARLPGLSVVMLLIALLSVAVSTLVHLVTLPVELDASFGKALPILEEGRYLYEGDLPHAQNILRAAAFTYVAGSLASLLSLGRWLTVLRR